MPVHLFSTCSSLATLLVVLLLQIMVDFALFDVKGHLLIGR